MRLFGLGGAMAAVWLVAGCAGVAGFGAPPFSALQARCGAQTDYGADAQAVYSTLLDAYVAYRHGRISESDYCAFEASLAERHAALASGDAAARLAWIQFFNDARVQAIDWRAPVDPSLRGG